MNSHVRGGEGTGTGTGTNFIPPPALVEADAEFVVDVVADGGVRDGGRAAGWGEGGGGGEGALLGWLDSVG